MQPGRLFLVLGAVNGALAVGAGAFGAHALKGRLSAEALATWETAARYHLIHALAVVAVGLFVSKGGTLASAAGWSLLSGIVLFSGSLYALSLTGLRAFGPVTPLGGVAFIAGWVMLAMAALRAGP